MEVIQVHLLVDDAVSKGIESGALSISAGIVRDSTGKIRKHLPTTTNEIKEAAKSAKSIIATHKGAAIGIGLGLAAVTLVGGTIIYFANKSKKKKEAEMTAKSQMFHNAMQRYVIAAQNACVTETEVNALLEVLEDINNGGDETLTLNISISQLNQLINSIFDYTKRLAKANDYKSARIKSPKRGAKNSMQNLQGYLEIQRDILAAA